MIEVLDTPEYFGVDHALARLNSEVRAAVDSRRRGITPPKVVKGRRNWNGVFARCPFLKEIESMGPPCPPLTHRECDLLLKHYPCLESVGVPLTTTGALRMSARLETMSVVINGRVPDRVLPRTKTVCGTFEVGSGDYRALKGFLQAVPTIHDVDIYPKEGELEIALVYSALPPAVDTLILEGTITADLGVVHEATGVTDLTVFGRLKSVMPSTVFNEMMRGVPNLRRLRVVFDCPTSVIWLPSGLIGLFSVSCMHSVIPCVSLADYHFQESPSNRGFQRMAESFRNLTSLKVDDYVNGEDDRMARLSFFEEALPRLRSLDVAATGSFYIDTNESIRTLVISAEESIFFSFTRPAALESLTVRGGLQQLTQ